MRLTGNPMREGKQSCSWLVPVGREVMDISTTFNSEHLFVPGEDTMTAVFASPEKAKRAIPKLREAGIPPDQVQLRAGADQPVSQVESPSYKQDTPGVEGLDEILHVFTETFSDDDKTYVQFDRVLEAGGALLSLPMNGREDQRSDVAALLRSHGALAVYYWGALATERL